MKVNDLIKIFISSDSIGVELHTTLYKAYHGFKGKDVNILIHSRPIENIQIPFLFDRYFQNQYIKD